MILILIHESMMQVFMFHIWCRCRHSVDIGGDVDSCVDVGVASNKIGIGIGIGIVIGIDIDT